MNDEDLIHVRLDYNEGVMAKKELLQAEMSLLKMERAIEAHHSLRKHELRIKLKLYNKIKKTKSEIKKIQINLPKIKIKEYHKEGLNIKLSSKSQSYDKMIENQLLDIQNKLDSLNK